MKTLLLDLDGTMYRGNQLIEGADVFIREMIKQDNEFYFLTNNARRTGEQNVEQMEKLGFKGIKKEQFFTSSMAAASYIARTELKRKAFVVGEDGLKEALINNGFQLVEDNADFVFVGLDLNGNYQLYSKALVQLLNGAQLVGTNSDRLLAHNNSFNIGNGSIVAMFEYATQKSSIQIGKPSKVILDEALNYIGKKADEVMIVGDNLETDILLGERTGVETVFVTSGVHEIKDIKRTGIQPSYIIKDLSELFDLGNG